MRYAPASSLLLVVCVLAVGPVLAGEGRIPIWEPVVITQPGRYVVTRNLTAPPGQIVIKIQSSNVDLDINGFTLHGSDTNVIEALGGENIVIHNGILTGGFQAVYLDQNRNVSVENLMISSPSHTGIRANSLGLAIRRNHIRDTSDAAVTFSGAQGTIENNVIESAKFGVGAQNSESVAVLNNRILMTELEAISLQGCTGCIVAGNTIRNAWFGIVLLPSSGSKVYNNVIDTVDQDGIHVSESSADNLILDNVVTAATTGASIRGSRNHIERNVLNFTTRWGLAFLSSSTGNTYGRNTARGSSGGPCTGLATTDFCDEGTGNHSFGDNYIPDLR